MLIIEVIEAKQRRDAIILDISNTFVQTDIIGKNGKKIITKIRGLLADILLEIDKDKHKDFVICQRKEKLLYIKILKTLYSMLATSILCYKKFRKDIEVIEYEVNYYNTHIASKIANSK